MTYFLSIFKKRTPIIAFTAFVIFFSILGIAQTAFAGVQLQPDAFGNITFPLSPPFGDYAYFISFAGGGSQSGSIHLRAQTFNVSDEFDYDFGLGAGGALPANGVPLPDGTYTLHVGDNSGYDYVQMTVTGGTYSYPSSNLPLTTTIIRVTPPDGETDATSTSFSLGAYIFVSPQEYATSSTFATVSYHNNGFAENQNPDVIGAISDTGGASSCPWYAVLCNFKSGGLNIQPVSGSYTFEVFPGYNAPATTTSIQTIGQYYLNVKVFKKDSSFFGLISNNTDLTSTSTKFTVATSTSFDQLQVSVKNGVSEVLTAASSTADVGKLCVPVSISFDPIACMVAFFIPQQSGINYDFNILYNGLLTRAPWGYLTRFQQILFTTSTSTLPTFDVTLQFSSTSTSSLEYNMADIISGGGNLLASIRDPIHGQSVTDVMKPFVDLTIASGVILTIVTDLLGSHRHTNQLAERNAIKHSN